MCPDSRLKVAEEEEEEEEVVVVVDSIDGAHEAKGCVIFLLVKFADEKKWLSMDRLMDRQIDRWTHL